MARPACIVSSGETTVHVTGQGKGGRNQEFALAAGDAARRGGRRRRALASVGTDGIDGPTDAAGALADSTTLEPRRARPAWRRAAFCQTTTPTRFSTRWAISFTPVRPARTSATFK